MFESFDYLDAAGNLMVIFTDGADADVLENGKSAFDVRRGRAPREDPDLLHQDGARRAGTSADWRRHLALGAWNETGGQFYPGRRRGVDP